MMAIHFLERSTAKGNEYAERALAFIRGGDTY